MSGKNKQVFTIVGIALLPEIALAYVGPGAGISVLGALWGLIAGIVMALGIVLFWPIRMMIRKRKLNAEAKNSMANNESAERKDTKEDSSNTTAQ